MLPRWWVLCLAAVSFLVSVAPDTHTNKVSDERKIPWAPRVVVERKEVAVFLEEKDCGLDVDLAFSVHNFRLQQDGDVLYRFLPSASGSDQIGRGVILCGKEGETPYGKPFFNCTLHMRFRPKWQGLQPEMEHNFASVHQHGDNVGMGDFLTEGRYVASSSATVQTLIDMIPPGRPRMQARLFVSKLERIMPTAAWASSNGWRGPPTAVLNDGALWIKCRGPLSGDDCVEDRWVLHPNETLPSNGQEPPWLALDMGGLCHVSGLLLDWGVEYGSDYQIETSDDGKHWTLVVHESGRTGARSDDDLMHTVHAVDLRKGDQRGGGASSELVRPQGIVTRFMRIKVVGAEVLDEGVSLWRVVLLGRRVAGQLQAHALRQDLVLYLADKSGNNLGISTKTSLVIIDPRPTATFVYLVAGRSCRDMSNLAKAEGHIIIQLTWGEPCQHDGAVLFLLNASQVQARNALVKEVQARRLQYLYLVFVDGDAELALADGMQEEEGGAWRRFERHLLWWLPAVGFPHHPPAPKHEDLEVELAFDFNSASSSVVAYHHEAVPLLLPYVTRFDNTSWTCSGVIQNIVAAALFHRNRIQFNDLGVSRARTAVVQPSQRPMHAQLPHRCTDAKMWIASAITSVDCVANVCWEDKCQGSMYARSPERRALPYMYEEGKYDTCHDYFRSKQCLHSDMGPEQCKGTDPSPEAAVVRLLNLIQQMHTRATMGQVGAGKPFRVRSIIHGGRQVGLVAASLDHLRELARREFGGSGHVVVLCCGGDTEVTTEAFFETLQVNEFLDVQFLGAWD